MTHNERAAVANEAQLVTDGSALLAAILAHPAEDTPRLMYADWLTEHGEDARAEFIRVQVALARLAYHCPAHRNHEWKPENWRCGKAESCECCRLRDRERFVWNTSVGRGLDIHHLQSRLPWEYGIADEAHICIVRRGFVAEVACTASDWLAHGDAIRAAHPVERVRLTTNVYAGRSEGCEFLCLALGDGGSIRRVTRLRDYPRLIGDRRIDTEALLAAEWPGVAFELPPADSFASFQQITADLLASHVAEMFGMPVPTGGDSVDVLTYAAALAQQQAFEQATADLLPDQIADLFRAPNEEDDEVTPPESAPTNTGS